MKYEIYGGHLPAVEISLDRGESIYTQSGAMAWMTDWITLDTNMRGGFLKSLGRAFAGDSMFQATWTADDDNQKITLSSDLPGEIRAFELDGSMDYIAQKGAFLGATPDVTFEAVFNKKIGAGLFGGEGFVLQKFSGKGTMFVEMDGSIRELNLQAGQKIKVSTSKLAMFEATCSYDIESVKGFKNILFSGEGLFMTVLTGPGKVWLQSMTAMDLANRVIPFIPTRTTTTSSD
ncbi:MAG: TIGR00266 family protein [Erysipelotrichaceae bacterium]|nr:TIGR00266 family protein [Erysipelotrichaceae bacterium]